MRALLAVRPPRCLLAACVALPLWHAGARAEESWAPPVVDNALNSFLLLELLEYQGDGNVDRLRWDAVGWLGGDVNRLWFKTEGGYEASGGDTEFQLLYGRLIAPFWDLQAGVRYDRSYRPGADRGRAFGIVGVQGLAPYWFELEPWLAVSEKGDVSARLTASYDLLLTQRLILQPRLETEVEFRRSGALASGRASTTSSRACGCATRSGASSRPTWESTGTG